MCINKQGFAHLILIIAAAAVVGGTTTAVASNSARPGDLLYGIDKAMESVRGALTFGTEAKANMYAQQAQERKGEIQSLLNGNASEENLDKAVRNYTDAMDKALEKASSLEGEAKVKVMANIAEKSLVNQDNFLEMAEGAGDQYQNTLENAFQNANQNFSEAGRHLSDARMEQVMTQARSQVRNMDGLLEQIQFRTQEQVQENKDSESGNQSQTPGSESSGNEDSNKPDDTGNQDSGSGSGSNGGNKPN